jgi:hypothetical protein
MSDIKISIQELITAVGAIERAKPEGWYTAREFGEKIGRSWTVAKNILDRSVRSGEVEKMTRLIGSHITSIYRAKKKKVL